MSPLDGIRMKVARAKYHLGTLGEELLAFDERKPCVLHIKKDALIPGKLVAKVEFRHHPPLMWGCIIGDIGHNLRSALEHIAFYLSRSHSPGSQQWTKFPIHAVREEPYGLPPSVLKGFPPTTHALIEELQPYHRETWPETTFLELVSKVNNADKHRSIVPLVSELHVTSGGNSVCRPAMIEDGDAMNMAIDPEMQGEISVSVNVAFRVPGVTEPVASRQLANAHDFIDSSRSSYRSAAMSSTLIN